MTWPPITWSANKWQSLDSHKGLLTPRGHHPYLHPCTSLDLGGKPVAVAELGMEDQPRRGRLGGRQAPGKGGSVWR